MASVNDRQIQKAAQLTGVPFWLLKAQVSQESGGRQGAVSPAGASGVEQLMPSTAARESRMHKLDTHTPFGNLLAGAYYLREQYNTFHRWDLALAAYNAGPGAVHQHGGIPPYAETQHYVKTIMSHQQGQGADLGSFGGPAAPAGLFQMPAAPSHAKEDAGLAGLQSLAMGNYDPSFELGNLLKAESVQTPSFTSPSLPGALTLPSGRGLAGGFLPKGATYKPGRKDQGRDGQTDPGGAIVAPGAGRVVAVLHDPSGFGPSYPVIRFTSGPYAGHTIYVGHTIAAVRPGQRIRPGQVVSRTGTHGIGNATVPGWFEIGYAPGGSPGHFGQPAPF